MYDIFIIGGGINGCGIARDAAGRGYSVYLCEADDLASGTSSQSTKLIHGGLRYLEHYEFRLVREALRERETLWQIAPHIIQPLRFVLPHHKGLRPYWLLRLGLFIYDNIGRFGWGDGNNRHHKQLPKSQRIQLTNSLEGDCLKDRFTRGFEYSDCSVKDSRLVILNAMDAAAKGACIKTRHTCTGAKRLNKHWQLSVTNQFTGKTQTINAKVLMNASGPWVDQSLKFIYPEQDANHIRLVQGSHIVVPKLYDHPKCYIFQNKDERIIFAIPYYQDYTLIGTTDHEYQGDPRDVAITTEEIDYLCQSANQYFNTHIQPADIVHTYAGVRSLYNDGAGKAQEATRDYVLDVDQATPASAPLINIFGGKITTYRKLAESVMVKVNNIFGRTAPDWTMHTPLPGGNFAIDDKDALIQRLIKSYPKLSPQIITRMFNSYGTETAMILKDVSTTADLGTDFGHGLYQREVDYLIKHEWAISADDILLRRTKLGLKFSPTQRQYLQRWLSNRQLN